MSGIEAMKHVLHAAIAEFIVFPAVPYNVWGKKCKCYLPTL